MDMPMFVLRGVPHYNSLIQEVVAETPRQRKRTYSGGVYPDGGWQGNTTEVKSKTDWQKDYVAHNVEYSEIEGYLKAGKKVIVVGIASHMLEYGGETSLENNSLDAVEAERAALWVIIHELVAHAFKISQGKPSNALDDHQEFQGNRDYDSPSLYDLINNKKYKNTKAGKLARKLFDYYDKEVIPMITHTSKIHEKLAKEWKEENKRKEQEKKAKNKDKKES